MSAPHQPPHDLAYFNTLLDRRQFQQCLDDLAVEDQSVLALTPCRLAIIKSSAHKGLRQLKEALDVCNVALTAAALEPQSKDTQELALHIMVLMSIAKNQAGALRCLSLLRKIGVQQSFELMLWDKHFRSQLAQWEGYAELDDKILEHMRAGAITTQPFMALNVLCSAQEEMKSTIGTFLTYGRATGKKPFPIRKLTNKTRYRLAYMSNDFRYHATTFLIKGMIEEHDRAQFELIAVTWGTAKKETDDASASILEQFDEIIDIDGLSDYEAAKRLHDARIDILVDLKGYTDNSRSYVLAYRPAPIQVNFLGYPGTIGSPCHDYIIADSVIIPPELKHNYTEFVARLPHCYQPNERIRKVSTSPTSRHDHGLRDDAFVFCCFNSTYKIHPEVFHLWCEILKNVPNSQLWLLDTNETASRNIRNCIEQAGIASDRLVFGIPIHIEYHLERLRHADLFLDTFPISAHTTASDALYAGVPVLSCKGDKFASRVAASLVTTLGLPELACEDFDEYFQKALTIAHQPEILAELKNKVKKGVISSPLYDPKRFAKNIEKAYLEMISRQKAGKQGDFLVRED